MRGLGLAISQRVAQLHGGIFPPCAMDGAVSMSMSELEGKVAPHVSGMSPSSEGYRSLGTRKRTVKNQRQVKRGVSLSRL
jgi:hypothetical protein